MMMMFSKLLIWTRGSGNIMPRLTGSLSQRLEKPKPEDEEEQYSITGNAINRSKVLNLMILSNLCMLFIECN